MDIILLVKQNSNIMVIVYLYAPSRIDAKDIGFKVVFG